MITNLNYLSVLKIQEVQPSEASMHIYRYHPVRICNSVELKLWFEPADIFQ